MTTRVSGVRARANKHNAWDGERPSLARHAPSGGGINFAMLMRLQAARRLICADVNSVLPVRGNRGISGRGPLAIRCVVDSRKMSHVECGQNVHKLKPRNAFCIVSQTNTMPFRDAFSRPASLIIIDTHTEQTLEALQTGQTMLVLVTPVGLIVGHKTGFRENM